MFTKLDEVVKKHEELTKLLMDSAVIADPKKLMEYNKALNSIDEIVEKYTEYKNKKSELDNLKNDIKNEKDLEMKEIMQEEIAELESSIPELEDHLKILLLPKDPNDEKNVIVEIRAAAGGDEAALFASDIFRMFTRYAERSKWKVEILDKSEIGVGGIKEITFLIKGNGAFSRLKFESGVHRVQRVPETESSGRIHTSTITVAVLPEVDDIEQVQINPSDLIIDSYRSSGAGGQHVNTTDSAVRITHKPTGIVVTCQNERSQIQNRETALKILKSKLFELELKRREQEIQDIKGVENKIEWGSQIRSYVMQPYKLVKDHRTKFEEANVEKVMNGDIDDFITSYLKTKI